MALSNPRSIFGVHSFSPYNITTGNFYGTMKVLDSSTLSLSGETIDLTGGSSQYPWAVENGLITPELSLSFSEYPDFAFELFLGKAPTANAAEASGSVTTLTDKDGVVVNATTGIASVALKSGSSADLKFAKYVVKVVSGTTVDVYASSDADFSRGTDKEFASDLLKITSSALTIPDSSGTVEIPGFGLELVGGSGTINLETAGAIGDTATFSVRPPNSSSMDVVIGGSGNVTPYFGAIIMAENRSSGEMFEIDCYKIKASGLPINFSKKEWSTAEVTAKVLYDSTRNGVFSVRHIIPT